MKLYMWEYLDQVSRHYHPEGGLVIVAEDRQQAEQLINKHNNEKWATWGQEDVLVVSDADWQKVHVYELADGSEPDLYVFPDAGCC